MKKKILFGALFLSYFAQAQINLEKTFPVDEAIYTFSSASDFVYISRAIPTLKIYNSDYTLRKTVNISIPTDYTFYFYTDHPRINDYKVSQHIFNTDDKYEFLIELYNSTTRDKKLIVVNEDSQLIYDFSSSDPDYAVQYYYIFNDPITNKNKIKINYQSKALSNIQKVYTLPSTTLSLIEGPKAGETNRKLYPIPAKSLVTFRNPENGSTSLEVFDATGKKVLTKEYNTSEEDITINVESLTKGIYILKSGNYSTKFIKE